MEFRTAAYALAMISVISLSETALGQAVSPTNSLPDPYRAVENWGQLPQGRTWGSTSGIGSIQTEAASGLLSVVANWRYLVPCDLELHLPAMARTSTRSLNLTHRGNS